MTDRRWPGLTVLVLTIGACRVTPGANPTATPSPHASATADPDPAPAMVPPSPPPPPVDIPDPPPADPTARVWHVSPDGDDANPGDAAQPFLTLGRAAAMVAPGDRVVVAAGQYLSDGAGAVLDVGVPGTLADPIRWEADPGATLYGGETNGSVGIRLTRAAYNHFVGFEIRGFDTGVLADESFGSLSRDGKGYPNATGPAGHADVGVELRGLVVHHNNSGIVLDHAPAARLVGLQVHDNGLGFAGTPVDRLGEGIRITYSDDVVVSDVRVFDNDDGDDGAYTVGDNGLTLYSCERAAVSNSVFYGNNMNLDLSGSITVSAVVSHSYRHAGLVSRRRLADGWAPHTVMVFNSVFYGGSGQAHIKNLRGGQIEVYNSTLVDSAGAGIVLRPLRTSEVAGAINVEPPGLNRIVNNIIVGSSGWGIEAQPSPNDEAPLRLEITTNLMFSNGAGPITGGAADSSVEAPAAFVDPSARDYRLQPQSAAVDAGADLRASVGIGDDADGVARPQGAGFDLGAFERQ